MFVLGLLALCALAAASKHVVINELAADGEPDWLELYNPLDAAVSLKDWSLRDHDLPTNVSEAGAAYVFGDVELGARGYLQLRLLAASNATSAADTTGGNDTETTILESSVFRLSASGETVVLFAADGSTVVDRVVYAKARNGTIGRSPDGADAWRRFVGDGSPGASNNNASSYGDAVVRDADWDARVHGSRKPLYDEVFRGDTLEQLVIEFDAVQWNASWTFMTEIAGPFGGGFTFPGLPMPGAGGMGMPPGVNQTMMMSMMMAAMGMDMADPFNGDALKLLPASPIYVWATIRYRGRVWRRVGFRFKGNSSLLFGWTGGSYKLPFRLDFDEFEDAFPSVDNQRFFGFKKMTFASNFADQSGMRESIMNDLYRSMDVPVGRQSLVSVRVDFGDGELRQFGTYTMIEDPGAKALAASQFDDADNKGGVFKPDGDPARLTLPYTPENYFQKEGDDDDLLDIKLLLEVLHSDKRLSDAAAWRADFEAVFDVRSFVRWLAVTRATGNWDQYGSMFPHNYFLYGDLPRVPFTFVAWDGNLALGSDITSALPTGALPTLPPDFDPDMLPPGFELPPGFSQFNAPPPQPGALLDLDLNNTETGDWPLVDVVYADPVYHSYYLASLRRLVDADDSLFGNAERFQAHVGGLSALISAELSQEAYPYSTLRASQNNTHAQAIGELVYIVNLFRDEVRTFVDKAEAMMPANNATNAPGSEGSSEGESEGDSESSDGSSSSSSSSTETVKAAAASLVASITTLLAITLINFIVF